VKAAVLSLPWQAIVAFTYFNRRDHGVEGLSPSAPIMKRFGNQALRCESRVCLVADRHDVTGCLFDNIRL
jgi:hypothetical protein